MTSSSTATPDEQPKGVAIPFICNAVKRLSHSASAGFVFTALLVLLGQRSGANGREGLELLQQFLDHAVPSKSLYLTALGFLGISATFSRALLAEILRRWIAKPLIELSSHAISVAIGAVLALAASAAYVADLRAGVGGLVYAAVISLGVFVVLRVALLVAEGKFDKLFQSHKAIEFSVAIAGVFVTYAAVQDMSAELDHAIQHSANCATLPSNEAR